MKLNFNNATQLACWMMKVQSVDLQIIELSTIVNPPRFFLQVNKLA